jgi:hypothetical protein
MLPALSEGCPPCRATRPDRHHPPRSSGEQMLTWPLVAATGLRCVRAVLLISCSGPRGGGRHVGGTRLAELFEGLKRCDQRSCGTRCFRGLLLEGRRKSMKPWPSGWLTSTSMRCTTSSTSPTPQRGTEAGPSAAGRASRADGTGETSAGGPANRAFAPFRWPFQVPLFTFPPQWFRLLQRPSANA